jgi:hypothetical protein
MKEKNNFPYPENEYLGWKNARKHEEDDSKEAYIKWRIERDKKSKEFSERIDKLMIESDERISKLTPEQLEGLKASQKRHARKVRIEIQGYDQHPNETKEEVFGKKPKDENSEKKK